MSEISRAGSITALTPDVVVRAWKDRAFARSLPAELRAELPANPAGLAEPHDARQVRGAAQQVSTYSSSCYSTSCYSSSCYSTSCYSSSCYSSSCYSSSCYSSSCHSTACHSSHCHSSMCHSSMCHSSTCHSAYCPTGAKYGGCGKP